MLGVQKCWELKNVLSSKLLGAQKCFELKSVGSSKVLGAQKCWEYKNVLQHFSPTKVKRAF